MRDEVFTRCIDPRLRLKVEALSPEIRDEFEERAAIIEYDGNTHRAVAEQEAWNQINAHAQEPKA